MENVILLSNVEIQSNHTRVKWAEGLIEQLPSNHEGRNSWLMNYGVKEIAVALREKRGLTFYEDTQSVNESIPHEKVRLELWDFLVDMERILKENAHKGDSWRNTSYEDLMERLNDETIELGDAVRQFINHLNNSPDDVHTKFNHPINEINGEITTELRKLRIALLFEELQELAEAGDLRDYFADLCEGNVDEWNQLPSDTLSDGEGKVNRVEELDALCDLKYVLDGAVLALGFGEVYKEGFKRVHNSNMSKLVKTWMKEQERERQEQKGYVGIKFEKVDEEYCIMTNSTGKVLKPSTYVPVDLKDLIPKKVELSGISGIPPMIL